MRESSKPDILRGFLYLRKSRAESLSDSTEETLRRHKETLEKLASQMGIQIAGVYEEVKSGEDLYVRTEMLRMLADIEKGSCDVIVCMDIDRLGRGNMSQQGVILETIKRAGVKILTPQKTYDLNDETDEEYTEFQSFFARRELKVIKKRMRRGIYKTVEEGGYIANAPYGYEKIRIGKLPSLRIVEEEAVFVRRMFELYAAGHGCLEIAKVVNAQGARPRRTTAFNRTTIMGILRNPIYAGRIEWNRERWVKPLNGGDKIQVQSRDQSEWIRSEGKHPPIVSAELFEKVQEIARNRYHPPYNVGQIVNPLAGLIICQRCGGKMQYRPFSNGDAYLLCPRAGCCKSTPFDRVEKQFLETLGEQMRLLETKQRSLESAESLEHELEQTSRKLEQLNGQMSRLYDLLESEVYTLEVFRERSELLKKRLDETKQLQSALQERLEKVRAFDPRKAAEKIRNVLEAYQSSTPSERNAMLKNVVEKATYQKLKSWPKEQFVLEITLKVGE